MNSILKKDVNEFINRYYKFRVIDYNRNGCVLIEGYISIVDVNGDIWSANYKVQIAIPVSNYPNVTPAVKEISTKIERNWDYHISEEGICCLAIPHKLLVAERRGINFTQFYQEFIYPFFTNHQHKLRTGKYANGEFEHHEKGILQFYSEELKTKDLTFTQKIIQAAIGKLKIGNNDKCPICNANKFKKCCKPKANKILRYGLKRLRDDLEIVNIELTKES
ncbi:hypothetical protein [Tamlana sp. I1]|uniref:hypothetical protein n=1 Tax=Tamlana sp. I1 TaxID=2762061 RepID=UPI00188E714F|nr:hypothetical protein [Tamlana sp. I1]